MSMGRERDALNRPFAGRACRVFAMLAVIAFRGCRISGGPHAKYHAM